MNKILTYLYAIKTKLEKLPRMSFSVETEVLKKSSPYAERRLAPGHFSARAHNARYSASVLWRVMGEEQAESDRQWKYGGSRNIALEEAFGRESGIALELVIKAVIATRIEGKTSSLKLTEVVPTHDLLLLWKHAELPTLETIDRHRLFLQAQVLSWSGRYAVPASDKAIRRALNEAKQFQPQKRKGVQILRSPSWDWADFDRIYEVASMSLRDLSVEKSLS